MSRTNIDVDETACRRVMARYGLKSKRDAVNFALKRLAEEPMSYEEALAMEGSGWEGDPQRLRQRETPAGL